MSNLFSFHLQQQQTWWVESQLHITLPEANVDGISTKGAGKMYFSATTRRAHVACSAQGRMGEGRAKRMASEHQKASRSAGWVHQAAMRQDAAY